MIARVFLDTNILVYAVDEDEAEKRMLARQLVAAGMDTTPAACKAVVSTQVLQEFYVTATRKIRRRLDPPVAAAAVAELCHLPVVLLDKDLVLTAIELALATSLSLWDALIVRAAQEADCSLLYSEDLQHDRVYGSVRVVNPFL